MSFRFASLPWSGPLAAVCLLSVGGACSSARRPPLDFGNAGAGGGSTSTGDQCVKPDIPDTASLCGSEVVSVEQLRPNLYFLLDSSGSMGEFLGTGTKTKLEAAKSAIAGVVSKLGHVSNYGLMHYPARDPSNRYGGCAPGEELFPLTPGDPLTCVNDPGGPVLDEFVGVLGGTKAEGGTPLSASLVTLIPELLALKNQRTFVLLVTDGAPNCNASAVCGIERCGPNIEGYAFADVVCDDSINCCDPGNTAVTGLPAPQVNCVDDEASLAGLLKLANAGIKTYVIGIPGAEAFEDVMNALATAGGTARGDAKKYYDPQGEDELLETLTTLGTEVTTSCTIVLGTPPKFPDMVNVYFDKTLVKKDPSEGWSLDGDTVTLSGDACAELSSGTVNQVQVLTGCPTIVK